LLTAGVARAELPGGPKPARKLAPDRLVALDEDRTVSLRCHLLPP
jgi:hypothetical protein